MLRAGVPIDLAPSRQGGNRRHAARRAALGTPGPGTGNAAHGKGNEQWEEGQRLRRAPLL